MGSSYLPPPEQNVVNVGDEISASALAGIQAASPSLSQANPAATEDYVASAIAAIPAPPPNITDYDNFKVYAAGEIVLTSNDFYRFNTFIGAAGYGPITHPSAWTKLSSQDLAGYALLSGATFTGKVNMATIAASTPSINLGGQCDSAPASATNGDIWISNAASPKITYRTGGVNYNVPVLNQFNTFTGQMVINTTSSSTAALRVTQLGTANAIEVEDSTTPDSTRFVVDANGKVGIGGVAPANVDDKVAVHGGNIIFGWPYGVRFGDGTSIYSVNALTSQIQSAVQQPIINYIFSGSSVYTGSASAYSQHLAYYDSANNVDVYVDYLSYTYDYSVAWNPSNMAFAQTNSSPSYPSQYTIVGTYTDSSGFSYGIRADGSGGVQDTIQI